MDIDHHDDRMQRRALIDNGSGTEWSTPLVSVCLDSLWQCASWTLWQHLICDVPREQAPKTALYVFKAKVFDTTRLADVGEPVRGCGQWGLCSSYM